MATLLELSIDVTKLDKEKFIIGKKGKYAKLTISINDETDQFGQDVSAYEAQTEDERKDKSDRNYVGNGKVFWSKELKTAKEKDDKSGGSKETKAPAGPPNFDEDIPF